MKKTKKGFTLIELLAVIAILGVLAIVAVPSIINLFKSAKQNTFISQAKNIFQAATDRFMADQVDSSTAGVQRIYCHDVDASDAGEVKLDLSGNSTIYYKVTINSSGVVTAFQVLDGSTYSLTKAAGTWTITDLTAVDGITVTTLACS